MKFVSRTITVLLLLAWMFSFMPGATSSASAATCYWAQFIADVTIPDGTNFMPGTAFTKTWRLKNIGSCAWNSSDVSLIFDSGEQMGAPTSVALPITVNPGQTVDISVNMTAPSTAGHYLGYYKFKSTSGGKFGIGSTANSSFWVDIYVASSSGTGYDFTANAASATWSSGAGTLTFPGTDGSANGFSLKKNNPKLENGVESAQAGLLFAPNNITNGYIQAVYPAFYVQSGDRFQTTIGCEYGSTTCYVAYRLDYQIGSGSVKTFWTFHEKYEGLSYNANLDLSSLAGQNVKFILVISAYGSPTGDRALWVNPIISRAGGGTSPTGTPTTATPIPSTCDRAQFIADVTVPDGTIFAPGSTFNKTWRLKNIGTCTWTNYSLIFDSGEKMSGPDSALIPTSVAPGQTVDITVPLTSPTTIGTYRGYWKLKNSTGVPFGIGSGGTKSFWVEIYVSSSSVTTPVPPVGGVSYDFAANACLATWFSGAGILPCPGSEGNSNGFVLKVAPSKLENGTNDSRLGLLTYPQNVYNGYIQGFYPAYTVKAGDRFRSIVNCEYNATSCYVVFRLEYQTGSDPIKSFWSFVEKYEGVYYLADIDLSPLVGKDVKFILTVLSTGSPTGDRALWVAPMIYNETGTIPPGASVTTINTDTPDPSMPGQNVAVNVSVNGAGATPTGTVVISGADTNCTITLSGGSGSCNVVFNTSGVRTLTATYSGDASHASSSGTASHSVSTVGLATSTTTIADIPDPTIPGQVVTVTVTVTGAGTTPTGTVDITGADTDCTLTLSGGSGSCTITFTTAGSKILTATYNGNVNYAGSSDTESHTVYTGLATTTTTITSEIPDPSTTGQAVVVSVTVSGAGIPKPSGTVVITGADTNCTLLLSGGSGSCSVTFNTTGTKNLTAAYSGDGDYAPSSGSASHTVNKVSTTTTITADTPDPSSPSQAVSVSVTVLGAGVTPTGTVQITGADINCTLTLSGGSGSCNVVFNTIGTKTLTATYSGDSNYLASVAEAGHTVANATTTVITSAIPDPSTIGAAVTVNVTVSGAGVTPTGTVAITGANTNCTITLAAGTGSCDVTFNTAGAKTLTATYSGDANYGSSSGSMSHTVIQGSTTTAITTVLPEPSAPFESVAVTVTVTGTGVTAATGTVAITGADTICTVTLASGSGSCNVVFNTSGSKTLTATYSGDGNYLSSSSTAIHTVGTATTPPAVYKYDFGTASSPLEPTFTRITETSVYSSGVAGWTNTSGLQSRDRLAPDDRLRDFVQHISAARTFKVDLPNGNYSVSITMGDNDHLHDDMIVKANGTTVLTNVDNAAGAFAVNTFVVTVSGGSLSLEFSDGGGADPTWIVNSLTITTPP